VCALAIGEVGVNWHSTSTMYACDQPVNAINYDFDVALHRRTADQQDGHQCSAT